MRRVFFALLSGAITGGLVLGAAWATSGLLPPPVPSDGSSARPEDDRELQVEAAAEAISSEERLPGGTFLVGAAKVSIAPQSVAEGGPWIRHGTDGNCAGSSALYTPFSNPSCLRTFDGEWATGIDEAHGLGVYVRALTISNGQTEVAFAVMDTVGWFYGYPPEICGDCGAKAIGESLEGSLGIPAENVVISSTHTHASADTVMASPKWYFELVRDATKQAITDAHNDAVLASIETGTIPAKAFNTDRRIITRAVPDYELAWLRAVASDSPGDSAPAGNGGGLENPGNPHAPGETIGTLVNFSVHPTITAGNADLHSGLVGHLAERLGTHWGGETLFIAGGLGDQTVNRGFGRDGFGYGLGDLVIESQATNAYTLQSNDIVSQRTVVQIPADNGSLIAANKAGVFVRDTTVPGDHAAGPSQSINMKGGARTPSCIGAGPLSVLTPVGGIRIGTPGLVKQRDETSGEWIVPPGDRGDALVIMQTPGEIFSSISATTKDYLSRTRNVMVLGLANDQIGYIIPAEQYDVRSANAAGLAQPSIRTFNYEESLSTGRCTGDQVQNALLDIGVLLDVLGDGERR